MLTDENAELLKHAAKKNNLSIDQELNDRLASTFNCDGINTNDIPDRLCESIPDDILKPLLEIMDIKGEQLKKEILCSCYTPRFLKAGV